MECTNEISITVRIIILLSGINLIHSFPQNNFPNILPSTKLLPPLPPATISTRILPPLHSNIYTNGLPENNLNVYPMNLNSLQADNYYANDKSSAGSYYHNSPDFTNEYPTKKLDPAPIKVPLQPNPVPTTMRIPTKIPEPIIVQRPNAPLSLAEWENYNIREPNGPGTYAWGYDIEDPITGNVQFRSEERHQNGTVTGSYGYLEPNGNVRITHYIADARGYRTRVENSRYKSPLATNNYQQSPQLTAAIQSQQIQQQNPNYSVRDQYQRPVDRSIVDNNPKINYFFIPTNKNY